MTQASRKHRDHIQKDFTASDLVAGPQPAPGRSRAGSIEQQLDMNEKGPLRGDEILHHHGIAPDRSERPEMTEDQMNENYHIDMAEDGREGDEETGDSHSSGLQADDQAELQYDTTDIEDSDSGAPGEMTEKIAHLDPSKKGYKRRTG